MRTLTLLAAAVLLGACGDRPAPAPNAEPGATRESPAPRDDRPVIVAFGDSLTAGFGADPGKSYPDFLQQELDRAHLRYRVVNAGISGETTTDAVARMDTVTALKPAIVIVEFGGNDGLRGLPVATTRANLDHIVAALKQSGAEVLLAGMTLPPNYGPDYIAAFERVFTDVAARNKVARIPFLLEGVAGTSLMQRDGLHPTADGNRLVAATVMRYLRPLLVGQAHGLRGSRGPALLRKAGLVQGGAGGLRGRRRPRACPTIGGLRWTESLFYPAVTYAITHEPSFGNRVSGRGLRLRPGSRTHGASHPVLHAGASVHGLRPGGERLPGTAEQMLRIGRPGMGRAEFTGIEIPAGLGHQTVYSGVHPASARAREIEYPGSREEVHAGFLPQRGTR
jgi:acyl-CoA thioesterase I